MKRQLNIRTHVLLMLIGLTTAILLAVGLAFNIIVRATIRSRVTTQLAFVSELANSDRRGLHVQHGKRFDERPDRLTGAAGNAVVLDKDGSLISLLRGDEEAAGRLADYFSANGLDGSVGYKLLSIEDEQYAVSVSDDPLQTDGYLVSFVDVTAILAFASRVNMVLLFIILAAILLSIVLSRHFAKAFSEPVQELSAFAHEVGSGNFEKRELYFRDVELGQLAESMNQMASELKESKKKQETFFQNVSHELRTPLTSIRGNAEGIVYGVMEAKGAAKVILNESDKLGGMVEDLLYLSRMGKTVPEDAAELLDLREVLSLCVSEQHAAAEGKGVEFSFDFAGDPVAMHIREKDAQRLFGNLISNAIRYASSKVSLTCREDGGSIIVRVSDDGPGISDEDLPHIFERFYKGRDGKHGIGLSIARSVVETYHGRLTAFNDEGAVFETRFSVKN
jgi:signal transduction histidine kinase